MSEPEFYKTIERPATAEFKDRGSKFIAFAYPLETLPDFKKYNLLYSSSFSAIKVLISFNSSPIIAIIASLPSEGISSHKSRLSHFLSTVTVFVVSNSLFG